jgi:hypothetical protein
MGEVRSALSALLRRPLYSGVAVAILTLGLSAGIGVFTYANGFTQPFPGVDSRGLVQVFDATDEDPFRGFSYLDYVDYAENAAGAFEGVAAIVSGYAASIRHDASTEVVFLEAVSGSYFPLAGVEMSAGRTLTEEDDRPGAEPVAVISYDWWQRQWNGDPGVAAYGGGGRFPEVPRVSGVVPCGRLATLRALQGPLHELGERF